MMKTRTVAGLAALLAVPFLVLAAEPAPAKARSIDLHATTYGGGFDGFGVRRVSGGAAVLEAKATPKIRGAGYRVEVPLRFAHRQTFGTTLPETRGSAGLEPWWQATKRLRLGLEADIFGAYRPGWLDLYQRDAVTGVLAPTDRYSYFAWRGGAKTYAHPAPHQHLRARYRFASYDYENDPAFSELDVMHVTPRDRTQHEVDLSWRYVERTWAFALRLAYEHRAYATLLARMANSGRTQDGSGTYVTPLQKLNRYEPSAELELRRMQGALELSFRYGLEVQEDPFQGYHSYTGHHPRVQARVALTERLAAAATLEGRYRTYGPNGSTRLEVGTGDRRTDFRTAVRGELYYRLSGGLSLRGEAAFATRRTNYRDYVPPASAFDVQFDYANFLVLAGVAYLI